MDSRVEHGSDVGGERSAVQAGFTPIKGEEGTAPRRQIATLALAMTGGGGFFREDGGGRTRNDSV